LNPLVFVILLIVRRKGNRRIDLALYRLASLVLAFVFLPIGSSSGQDEPPIAGTAGLDGHPIAGVTVSGGIWKNCCPAQRDRAISDNEGKFRLKHPGRVIHFYKDGISPQTVVLDDYTKPIYVALQAVEGSLILPKCAKTKKDSRAIGWGKYGLRFGVPTHSTNIAGGKPDVDYVQWIISPQNSSAHLALWFGPYAANLEPEDDRFINSASFTQRTIVVGGGAQAGIDSRGKLREGGEWRHTAVLGQGAAMYTNANLKDKELFDQIIDSICEVPYPAK
jgi:hypothetical protein